MAKPYEIVTPFRSGGYFEDRRWCRDCGLGFNATAPNQVRCPQCQAARNKERDKRARERAKARRARG